MDFNSMFSLANLAALAGWIALIFLPRWASLTAALRYGLIGLLSLAYAVLVFLYFFRVEGGGFGSITEVRALFQSDPVLLAGWIHYLAFDLFVGLWIAEQADRSGMSHFLQVPILVLTFMFGPAGLFAYFITRGPAAIFSATGRN